MIPMTTEIEVVAIKGLQVTKKVMTYSEALNLKRKKGWVYKIYQKGYSQFRTGKEKIEKAIKLNAHHGKENNRESQESYNLNLETYNNNCRILMEHLLSGKRLSGMDAIDLGVMEYRKRFDDLKKLHGIPVKSDYAKKHNGEGKERYKEWWLEKGFIAEFLGSAELVKT